MIEEKKKIALVEDAIKILDYPTPIELWESVKGKISQSEFDTILGYLIRTNHILMNNGDIIWTWNPETVDRIFSNRELLIA